MKRSTFLIGALCVVAMFSGCLDQGDAVELSSTHVPSENTGAPTPTGAGTGLDSTQAPGPTSSPEPTEDEAPEEPTKPRANLTVDAPNGSIPFEPTFTFDDAADGGGPYNWTIDFGEGNSTNGTGLPAAVSHTYDTVGDYVVNLTIENPAGESKASLNVTAKDFAVERYSGEWSSGVAACGVGTTSEWLLSDQNETTHVEFPINNTTWDMPFSVVFDGDADSWKVDFYDEDHMLVDGFQSSENGTVNGTVPEDAALVVLWACAVPGGGSAEYVSASEEDWARQERQNEQS